jgi:2-polyprenyl-3-methyl-5-hydroxy-6-metoxy-1,4-benzoquinol methylase
MNSSKSNKIFQATDHLVSGECFDVYWDDVRQRAWTDVEHLESMDLYYESADYISHHTHPHSLVQQLYVGARTLMLNYKYALLKTHLSPKAKLLDIGCGTGSFLSFMKSKGFAVFGVENHPKAKSICLENNLEVHSNEDDIAEAGFDLITLWHVLEHLPNPEKRISVYKNLLKVNGLLVVAVPNFESHDRNHYQEDWAALDVPRHLWHFTSTGLISAVEKMGFELVKIRTLGFDVFYVCYLSEKQRGKSFSLFRGILKGAFFSLKALFTKKHSSRVFVFRKRSL